MTDGRWVLSERETKGALSAARDAELITMWHAARVTDRAPLCGEPFGAGPYRWDSNGRRVLDGCSTCADAACPGCGKEVALRRWALTTLAVARHQAQGGQVVMMSVAGQHTDDEPVADTVGRLRTIVQAINGDACKRTRERLGVVGMVRRIEPTFGGRNGCHPNAHWLLLLEGRWDDLDARAERVQEELTTALAEWACGKRMDAPVPGRWEVWRRFSSPTAVLVTAAGVSAASYLAKLDPDAGETSGAAFELTDPSGSKATHGNVGDRAFCGWAAKVARANGYGPRRFRAALRLVPELEEAVGQFRAWRAATAGWHLFSPSRGLFADWRDWTLDRLLTAASEVADAEEWATVLRVLGLADGEDEAPEAAGEDEATGGPFDDELLDRPAPPERDPEHLWIDQDPCWSWWDEHPDPMALGGMLGAIGMSIALNGPYRTLLDVAERYMASGEAAGLQVIEREGDPDDPNNPPVLWLTTSEAVDGGHWQPLSWSEVHDRARYSARWALTPFAPLEQRMAA